MATAQEAVKDFDVQLELLEYKHPEIQAYTVREVAEYFVKEVSNTLHKPVVKEDVGFEIEALNGFPGPYAKYINEWILPEKIVAMMTGETNRHAKFLSVLSYCEPGSDPLSFISERRGLIANEVRGENGWGIDKIFIPFGMDCTLASLSNQERVTLSNKNNWIELVHFLKKDTK